MINPSNLCTFEGRIVRDPNYSTLQFGQDTVEKAMFTIAVDRALSQAQRQKVKAGDQSVKTSDFIPCSLMGGQVKVLRDWFPVGKGIKVIGRYTEYTTTDQSTGQKKYGHIFEVDNISFTVQDSKKLQNSTGQQQPQQNYQQPQQAAPQAQQPQNNFAMFDENDTPF